MRKILVHDLREVWSTTRFAGADLTRYARRLTTDDTRRGLAGLSLLVLVLLVAEAALFSRLGLGRVYIYTCALLALLAAHIYLSSGSIREIKTLYLLGMTLLVVSGTAFVLLAHQTGSFEIAVFASVALLFMVVPIVPWGLREALLVTLLIYGSLTVSTLTGRVQFGPDTLLTLQFVMLGSGAISLALVVRNTSVRRDDIEARFELEQARDRLFRLSNQDPLTGAWNRRYFKDEFEHLVEAWQTAGKTCYLALVDLNDFKPINDEFGHEYGDRVLEAVSHTFSALLGGDGFVVRLGGDEFALLFADHAPEALVDAALAELPNHLEPPAASREPRISMSLGILAIAPDAPVARPAAYRTADAALYAAKERKQASPGTTNFVIRHLAADSPGASSAAA